MVTSVLKNPDIYTLKKQTIMINANNRKNTSLLMSTIYSHLKKICFIILKRSFFIKMGEIKIKHNLLMMIVVITFAVKRIDITSR